MDETKDSDKRKLVEVFENLLSEAKAGNLASCALTAIREDGTVLFSRTGSDLDVLKLLGAVEALKGIVQRRVHVEPTKGAS